MGRGPMPRSPVCKGRRSWGEESEESVGPSAQTGRMENEAIAQRGLVRLRIDMGSWGLLGSHQGVEVGDAVCRGRQRMDGRKGPCVCVEAHCDVNEKPHTYGTDEWERCKVQRGHAAFGSRLWGWPFVGDVAMHDGHGQVKVASDGLTGPWPRPMAPRRPGRRTRLEVRGQRGWSGPRSAGGGRARAWLGMSSHLSRGEVVW